MTVAWLDTSFQNVHQCSSKPNEYIISCSDFNGAPSRLGSMHNGSEVGLLSIKIKQRNSVTKIIYPTFVNWVRPKAGAQHEPLFNKLASATLIKAGLTCLSSLPMYTWTNQHVKHLMSQCPRGQGNYIAQSEPVAIGFHLDNGQWAAELNLDVTLVCKR